jgi:hypothetical protein
VARRRISALTWGLASIAVLLVPGAAAAATSDTIFGSATPATINSNDPHAVEVGVKFTSEVAGHVTGIRFYKAVPNTGAHVGSLWSASGTLLASATFTNETPSGWQQVSFATPVAIAANTTYVAAYFAPKGDYSDTASGFASAGTVNPPLTALANPVSPNGVYKYSSTSAFPTSAFKATNYWVDVDFEPASIALPGQVTSVSATAGSGSATVTWSAPASGGVVSSYTITPYIGATAQTATTIAGAPPATSTTITGLTNGTSYSFTVQASNSAGSGPASEHSNVVTPTGATAPAAPSGITATAGEASATVKWTAPADGGSPITQYTITPYIGATAQTATTISGAPPATSTMITGLTNGTAYTFIVTATNAIGTGPPSEHSGAVTPSGEAIAYPDLQLVMPTGEISIVQSGGARTLEFTHISTNLGAGPFEMRPTYNAKTGISQISQALYTMPQPGVWQFAKTIPTAGTMIWDPPSDYRFPLNKFGLYTVASGGGVGTLIEPSPKVDYCMTSDTFVGGVPNAPNKNEYNPHNCTEPEGILGFTVGWGDQYDATDGGEGIPITSLPNGTYWLQGEIDPYDYFTETNTSNNLTDTKLEIEGATVRVLEQTHPNSTPATVTLASPEAGATLSGTVPLTATASGPAPIASVQFLLDGQPIGAPVTSPPYTINWTVGSTPPGSHYLSAQATDTAGFIGTASPVPVTTLEGEGKAEPPTVSIVNPVAGATVSGTREVTANVSDSIPIREVQFFLDGKPLGAPVGTSPYAVSWETTTATNASHTLTAIATNTAGEVGDAAPVTVTVENPGEEGACFVMDVNTTVNGKGAVTTSAFNTSEAGEELLAFVASDGPGGAKKQSAMVSGAGLTWTLVARGNTRSGDAEIWAARSLTSLANATVTSTPAVGGYNQSLTVISMQMSNGIGAAVVAGAASGAPSVSLKTTEDGSLVYGVGEDYTHPISRTLGVNQVLLRQDLDTESGNTFWSQYTGAVTGPAGETVTLNDPAPATDEWNMAAVEILGDGD